MIKEENRGRNKIRTRESLIQNMRFRIKEWEKIGIIPKIRYGKVIIDERTN